MKRYRFLKGFIYKMKMRYGEPLTITRFGTPLTNYTTGQITKSVISQYNVLNAVVFTKDNKVQFDYDLSFIAVNKNFTYGGQYVAGSMWAMLDRDDLGPAFSPSVNDEIIYKGSQYVIEHIQEYEEERILLLSIKRLEAL